MALGQLLLCIVSIDKNTNSAASFLETIANRDNGGQATSARRLAGLPGDATA
jgi:hypothetical protein